MEYENQTPVYPSSMPVKKKEKRLGLSIASIVLGGLSMICCWAYGMGIIPGIIAVIFGIISVVSGEGKARTLGTIGLILGAVGIVLAVVVLVYYCSLINWDNVTWENLSSIQYIDTSDSDAVQQWVQQFFKSDVSWTVNY
jgi:hypothetical protein